MLVTSLFSQETSSRGTDKSEDCGKSLTEPTCWSSVSLYTATRSIINLFLSSQHFLISSSLALSFSVTIETSNKLVNKRHESKWDHKLYFPLLLNLSQTIKSLTGYQATKFQTGPNWYKLQMTFKSAVKMHIKCHIR